MINLKFQYNKLFSIKINHNYYPGGISNDFIIIPTPRTVKLIDKMSMLIRNKEGEIHLLYDASALDKLRYKLIHSNDSESKLSFVVYSKNQYFSSITDIPFDLHNKVFYCSNKNLGIYKEGTLHNGDYVHAKDLITLIPQAISEEGEDNLEYKLILENGESKTKMPVTKINKGCQIDTQKLLEGHYNLFENDKELSSFINIDSKIKGSPIGFIDIFLNQDIKLELIAEIESNEVKGYNYNINFNSRSIFWKYIVVPTYLKRVKELEITCQKSRNKLTFKSIGEESINEKKVISFISEELVKFNKFYEYEIQLKKKEGSGGGKTIIKKMPYASFDLLKPAKDNKYMSEIYVYI